MKKILVIGAGGQIGTELVLLLEEKFGKDAVWASDIKDDCPKALKHSNYVALNVLDNDKLSSIVKDKEITDVYLLAALLSATAEKDPKFAWKLNMDGLFNVLDLAKDGHIKKVFWPSSIAVFGPTTPKRNTPQHTIMEPSTVYGISKQAGEQWCAWYHEKYGVDVRSIRYPGLISYSTLPGGGTTDYAVDIFYHAKQNSEYTCFVNEETTLPMMYMDDAVRATVELMEAPASKIKIRSSYNLGGVSFTPEDLKEEIKKQIPDFKIGYEPDFRQKIADSWPESINDESAQKDWGWKHEYDLKKLVGVMLENVDTELMFNK
ncbi:NAD-dependent epimerase/dehydratase family protein [Brumimicrobium glaciale]|jgi:nucleoside-diphosphate-sugar epimerase|uniref:NAD-dependent epimerase/dehydratase family protein n=1 Tax=Brumimicrobium glaciale TaxID=200475 RepID=A0A4V1WFQ4_9FLAO|nr:NAD-dependent epimerase/dehydratase family protein [Brumimicrobium glaciale]RYM34006.1 NAD-dependent epimerase/dehydratase family protein [Brumimicrobium glaciale]